MFWISYFKNSVHIISFYCCIYLLFCDLVIFPRRKHRPACYGEGEGRLLLSPGAVDMGGLWAVPERKDFDTLDAETIQALYDELCMTRQDLAPVIANYNQHWEDLQPI